MLKIIQAIRGMNDLLPDVLFAWRHVEQVLRDIVESYGYREIRTPIVESTALFQRSIGEVTDIVEKEMYTFEDRNGDSLTLRPEGTAGCVRAGIEHGLFYNQVQRLWYQGPLFRHERPQKGRYRQFNQFGVEAFGMPGPDIDAEMILMTARMWQKLGLSEHVTLQLNSLGDRESRKEYHEKLVAYLSKHHDQLDEDSQRRLHTNPLRVLDSKNPDMQSLIQNAPKLLDEIDAESRAHFDRVRFLLDQAEVSYVINPCLVRGLDYYSRTVFEWSTDCLGAQSAICGGGRFDYLVEQLGGHVAPAIGFAIGLERLIALLEHFHLIPVSDLVPDIYFALVGVEAEDKGLLLAEHLRDALPSVKILMNASNGSLKSQLKKADKSGATLALILGANEIEQEVIAVKFLREEKDQVVVSMDELISFLEKEFVN
ncbi:MAG: histidine--tRNA ligase [Gammaproteobacteria bacterium]|nr:histidine--tRNA ligase [Gammaproteobacteria bacterium]MBU1629187.1 histidine--tRNA ligase [Gammaproteobacteria bacterium]MBU2545930.1 histidine--tRNA ligase [Gammaproteobacteria bacterium]